MLSANNGYITEAPFECDARSKCDDLIAGWTVGNNGFCFGEDYGTRLGKGGYIAVYLQVAPFTSLYIAVYLQVAPFTSLYIAVYLQVASSISLFFTRVLKIQFRNPRSVILTAFVNPSHRGASIAHYEINSAT